MARFKPGEGGRKRGATNRVSRTVKETLLEVFTIMQDDPKNNLLVFAKKYPRDFYQIAAKLIPTEIDASATKMTIHVVRSLK